MTVSATELAEMRKTMTGKAIAQKLGVSIGTVTNHLKKHGLTGNRGRPAKKK
jgi:DNA-binding CsgD family transcriptional regulator